MTSRSNHALRQAARYAARAAGGALDLALVGALAVAAAYCTWVWLAPHARAAPPPLAEPRPEAAPSAAARGLFAAAAPQAASAIAVRVVGVMAPRRALFIAADGRPHSAAVGESVGGVELVEVHSDHVIVSRG